MYILYIQPNWDFAAAAATALLNPAHQKKNNTRTESNKEEKKGENRKSSRKKRTRNCFSSRPDVFIVVIHKQKDHIEACTKAGNIAI